MHSKSIILERCNKFKIELLFFELKKCNYNNPDPLADWHSDRKCTSLHCNFSSSFSEPLHYIVCKAHKIHEIVSSKFSWNVKGFKRSTSGSLFCWQVRTESPVLLQLFRNTPIGHMWPYSFKNKLILALNTVTAIVS